LLPPLLWVALITGGTTLVDVCYFANRSIRAAV
jgi:hypothetical protein